MITLAISITTCELKATQQHSKSIFTTSKSMKHYIWNYKKEYKYLEQNITIQIAPQHIQVHGTQYLELQKRIGIPGAEDKTSNRSTT